MKHYPLSSGAALPMGATIKDGGVNFSIFSEHAEKISLVFLHEKTHEVIQTIPFNPQENKTGYIWHIFVHEVKFPLLYAYRVEGLQTSPTYYNPKYLLLDPYAKLVKTTHKWGEGIQYHPIGIVDHCAEFDWEGVTPPGHLPKDLIIYEMHVRGFTQDPSSHVKNRGTFLGMIEKIPYLLDLGINAIELMPIHEFNECANHHINPKTDERLYNFWGYAPINYFFPMQRYCASEEAKQALFEFKTMVKQMHRHGIEVFIDVVFNHTGEKKADGTILSFLGIDRPCYYLLEKGADTNFTGCGNTLNCNHPIMQQFLMDSLRYFVTQMHVDGFRFDLASIFNRDMDGNLLNMSSIIANMTYDPFLAKTKLIAEPWDAAGAYQLGGFFPKKNRWSEWNGKYRDALRSFIKGDLHSKNDFAAVICGSQLVFPLRNPEASINFITVHDGFTLTDLVCYEKKHNEENGEKNQDGNNTNFSANYGFEGPTEDLEINQVRLRQKKNFILALMVSQGVPMILMGDEYGHTKKGNNNTWCHDGPINYFLWDELPKNKELFCFFKALIHFRKTHSILRRDKFFRDNEIKWHGLKPNEPLWESGDPFIAFTIVDFQDHKDLYIAFNATAEKVTVELPPPPTNRIWNLIVDTSKPFNQDQIEKKEPLLTENLQYEMIDRCAIIALCDHSI